MGEPRASYTEWNKSERRQISYEFIYVGSKRWYLWSYVQGGKGDTDVKNRFLDSVGEGEDGMIWENSIETYAVPHVKQVTSASLLHEAGHLKPVLCDNLEREGGEGVGQGGLR